jgi:hypothetical protein
MDGIRTRAGGRESFSGTPGGPRQDGRLKDQPGGRSGAPGTKRDGGLPAWSCLPEASIRPFRPLSHGLHGEDSAHRALRGPPWAESSFPPGVGLQSSLARTPLARYPSSSLKKQILLVISSSLGPGDCCTTAAAYGADGRLAVLYREETDNERGGTRYSVLPRTSLRTALRGGKFSPK